MGFLLDKRRTLIWLSSIKGIGYNSIERLYNYFGEEIDLIWTEPEGNIKKILNRNIKGFNNLIKSKNLTYYKKTYKVLEDNNINVITILDENYPDKLRNIEKPPFVLFYKGNLNLNMPIIGIVGARKSSAYGRWASYKFAKELTRYNIGIISGLALGIDTEAHKGAISNNHYNIGVLGCGLDIYYPKQNKKLMEDVKSMGCIISEFFLGEEPFKNNFRQRNRIISGLSDGIIVIEAGERSGSLITVNYALDQGKEVYALPGNINSFYSKGSNKLIRDGAKILLDVKDILEDLGIDYKINSFSNKEDLSKDENYILNLIHKSESTTIDNLVLDTKLSVENINIITMSLELKGYIKKIQNKIFTLVS